MDVFNFILVLENRTKRFHVFFSLFSETKFFIHSENNLNLAQIKFYNNFFVAFAIKNFHEKDRFASK